MSLTYNSLNLPATVSKAGLNMAYTYDATGNKLKKINGNSTRDYIQGIEYQDNSIELIHTEEGLAQRNGSSYSYHYNLKDHLGNVRYTFDVHQGAIRPLQANDYYPFGLSKNPLGGSNNNKYLYNSKELQEELGQYDYGARFYDPVIGRWNVVDPLSEFYVDVSPHNYALNNPVRFTDKYEKGDKLPTPDKHPEKFKRKRGDQGWENTETGEIYHKSKASHANPGNTGTQWKVWPKGTTDFGPNSKKTGERTTLDPNGTVIGN